MTPAISRTMGPAEWAMLLALSAVWGGSFYFFAIALRELPVFTIVFARVALGAAALWLVIAATRTPVPRDRRVWRDLLIMGILNNAVPFSLIVWGQKEIAAGLAAVINATTPFFTVLLASACTRDETMSWNRLAGALAGLGGVGLTIGVGAVATLGAALPQQLAIVAAAVCYAAGSVFARRFAPLPPMVTAAGQTTGSSLVLLPIVLVLDRPWELPAPHIGTAGAIVALGLLCTSFAYILYFTVLKRAGATNLVLVTFLVPVSAILLSAAFLGEPLGGRHVLGMAAIALGLASIDGRLLRRLAPGGR